MGFNLRGHDRRLDWPSRSSRGAATALPRSRLLFQPGPSGLGGFRGSGSGGDRHGHWNVHLSGRTCGTRSSTTTPTSRGGWLRLRFHDRLGLCFGSRGGICSRGVRPGGFLHGLRCMSLQHGNHYVRQHHRGSAAQFVSALRELGKQFPTGDTDVLGELMDSRTRRQLGCSGFLVGFGHVRLLRAHWRQLRRGLPRLPRLKVNRKHRGLRGRVRRRGVQPRTASRRHRRCVTW